MKRGREENDFIPDRVLLPGITWYWNTSEKVSRKKKKNNLNRIVIVVVAPEQARSNEFPSESLCR